MSLIYLLQHTIDRSAEEFPQKEAFRFYSRGLSYQELVERANQLAHTLQELGVCRGDRVGVYMNKCLEMPISIYGIMKAGAAYVPLDPAAPPARLKFMIRDCDIRHLITQNSKQAMIKTLVDDGAALQSIIGLEPRVDIPLQSISWEEIQQAPDHAPLQTGLTGQDLAYIMYTSGSTGAPKGIMHTHYSGLSYAKLSAHTYGLSSDDRLGNHAPLHFDISTFDYFSGPLSGATTILIPEEYTKLPASLSQLIEAEKLTIWYSVPFALIQLLLRGALDSRNLTSLRWVLFGGEPFPVKYLRELMKKLPGARFSNVYGPAEVNQCTYYHLPGVPDETAEHIPIGRIWEDTEGLIVDKNDQPVTDGECGELLIRSATMMRGYWGRPDLTERSLYRREMAPGAPDVFYRTGDLVQMLPDGNLQFLGRKDRQIKTRGYRVELDEIEAALLAHPQVEGAAAYAVLDEDGSQMIQAAVTGTQDGKPAAANLRSFLADRLPHYAIPREIRIVDDFPRTPTGKIDRRRLAEEMVDYPQEQ